MITRCTKRNSVVVFSLLVCSVGVTWWVYSYSTKLQNDLNIKKEEIALNEAHKKDLAVAEAAASAVEDDRQLLGEYFLTENETVSFLTDLESAARADGVTMETESLLIKDDKKLPYIELKIGGMGSQASLAQFLKRLEALRYSSWIESMSWSKTGTGVSAEVTLNILLLPS